MNKFIEVIGTIIEYTMLLVFCCFLIFSGYIVMTYEPSKTKTVKTLVCSGKVIVADQDHLYMEKGVSWRFPHGSYTPSQGEVCSVQGREVNK